MKIKRNGETVKASRIVAADEDLETTDYDISETIDDLADDVEDIQDTIDDVQEDDVDIELDNNIANHFTGLIVIGAVVIAVTFLFNRFQQYLLRWRK